MNVVIMGCGRVGSRLAGLLADDGHDVAVMDVDPVAFRRLTEGFRGRTVVGNGVDQQALREAGIEKADVFVALAHGDNRNAMAVQVAKQIFGVERVVARIYDPARAELYHELGIATVSPTSIITDLVWDATLGKQPAVRS